VVFKQGGHPARQGLSSYKWKRISIIFLYGLLPLKKWQNWFFYIMDSDREWQNKV